jgi:hypothetical protein
LVSVCAKERDELFWMFFEHGGLEVLAELVEIGLGGAFGRQG